MRKDKELQLGMKFGTANNILNRNLFFHLAKKCGMNKCLRCGEEINSAKELSKDHIVDWLNSENAIELFFNPENVVFSHQKCNIRRARGQNTRGIHLRKDQNRSKPWCAHLSVKGKTVYLGYYATENEAKQARDNYLKNKMP